MKQNKYKKRHLKSNVKRNLIVLGLLLIILCLTLSTKSVDKKVNETTNNVNMNDVMIRYNADGTWYLS